MEFNKKTKSVVTAATLLDATEEKPVDADVVLPDYCADVAAILCCELTPSVTATGWNGDKLTVDGMVNVRVLYLDEERRCMHTYEVSQAFSTGFITDGRQGETAVLVTTETEYLHCRAVSPRRLDIHGAFCVHATAVGTKEQQALAAVEEESVYVQTRTVTACVPAGNAQKPFSVNEALTGGEGIERVLRSTAVPTVSEVKVLAGKIIVKGDLTVDALLLRDGQTGQTEEKHFTLPYSQMMDLAGVDETATVDAWATVLSHSLRLEEDGGEKALCSHTKLSLSAQMWKEECADVITDAYHTAMPVSTESEVVTARRLLKVSDEPFTLSQTLPLPENVASVLSVFSEAKPISVEVLENRCTLCGRLMVHLLSTDDEGQVQYYNRSVDFSKSFETAGDLEEMTLLTQSTDATVETKGQLTVHVALCAHRRQYDEVTTTVLSALAGDENAAYPACDAAVKMVYADAGESLWSVAKSAHTSIEALKAENDLNADVLEKRTMLLVPLT